MNASDIRLLTEIYNRENVLGDESTWNGDPEDLWELAQGFMSDKRTSMSRQIEDNYGIVDSLPVDVLGVLKGEYRNFSSGQLEPDQTIGYMMKADGELIYYDVACGAAAYINEGDHDRFLRFLRTGQIRHD